MSNGQRERTPQEQNEIETIWEECKRLFGNIALDIFLKKVQEYDRKKQVSEYIKGGPTISISTSEPTDTTNSDFQGSDWQPSMFYDPEASKKDAEVTISSHKLNRLRELLAECQAVLEFYGDKDDWNEFFSEGNIFDEQEGDTLMAFNKGEDTPWTKAREMLGKLREVK